MNKWNIARESQTCFSPWSIWSFILSLMECSDLFHDSLKYNQLSPPFPLHYIQRNSLQIHNEFSSNQLGNSNLNFEILWSSSGCCFMILFFTLMETYCFSNSWVGIFNSHQSYKLCRIWSSSLYSGTKKKKKDFPSQTCVM